MVRARVCCIFNSINSKWRRDTSLHIVVHYIRTNVIRHRTISSYSSYPDSQLSYHTTVVICVEAIYQENDTVRGKIIVLTRLNRGCHVYIFNGRLITIIIIIMIFFNLILLHFFSRVLPFNRNITIIFLVFLEHRFTNSLPGIWSFYF